MKKQEKKGLIYVFTGDGKGKTSASMWTAMRAALAGKKVAVIHWYKEKRWRTNDMKVSGMLPNLKDYLMGKGFYKLPTDHADEDEHVTASKMALVKANELLQKVDVLVLDEVLNAITDGLLEEEAVLKLLMHRGSVHVVLSGRGVSKKMIEIADLVTEMKKIKHPFDLGRSAERGLDF